MRMRLLLSLCALGALTLGLGACCCSQHAGGHVHTHAGDDAAPDGFHPVQAHAVLVERWEEFSSQVPQSLQMPPPGAGGLVALYSPPLPGFDSGMFGMPEVHIWRACYCEDGTIYPAGPDGRCRPDRWCEDGVASTPTPTCGPVVLTPNGLRCRQGSCTELCRVVKHVEEISLGGGRFTMLRARYFCECASAGGARTLLPGSGGYVGVP